MREVSCVGDTPRACDHRSRLSILDGPLFFEANLPKVMAKKFITVDQLSRAPI